MNENELREWLERLVQNAPVQDKGDMDYDSFIHGCADGEAHLASEILRKFLK
jgi:hypothetical protein